MHVILEVSCLNPWVLSARTHRKAHSYCNHLLRVPTFCFPVGPGASRGGHLVLHKNVGVYRIKNVQGPPGNMADARIARGRNCDTKPLCGHAYHRLGNFTVFILPLFLVADNCGIGCDSGDLWNVDAAGVAA